jgi:hypothetical protein
VKSSCYKQAAEFSLPSCLSFHVSLVNCARQLAGHTR